MDTAADLPTVYNKIGDVIAVQSDDAHVPYGVPLAVRLARSSRDMESRKVGNKCPFEFSGDMTAYLSKLGTDAKGIRIWLQRGADGISAVQSKGVKPAYVLAAEVEATTGGDIENGLWAGTVGEQLYHLLHFDDIGVLHGSKEKGCQWKE
jgi:hypothetical protein